LGGVVISDGSGSVMVKTISVKEDLSVPDGWMGKVKVVVIVAMAFWDELGALLLTGTDVIEDLLGGDNVLIDV